VRTSRLSERQKTTDSHDRHSERWLFVYNHYRGLIKKVIKKKKK